MSFMEDPLATAECCGLLIFDDYSNQISRTYGSTNDEKFWQEWESPAYFTEKYCDDMPLKKSFNSNEIHI